MQQAGATDPLASDFDSGHFRTVLGQYPTGVCVITAVGDDGAEIGMVVGSFTSVSLDPPLVGFLPDKQSSSWAKLRTVKRFCINILSVKQEDVCRRLASKDADKFSGISHSASPLGSPIIQDVVAWIDCEMHAIQDAGDHEFALGLVRHLETASSQLPLLFFQGGYGRFSPSSMAAADGHGQLTEQLRIADCGRADMEALAAEISAQCITSACVNNEVVVLANAGRARRNSPLTLVGQRLPFIPPTGNIFAAWLPQTSVDQWVAEHCDPKRAETLSRSLQTVRERGYSIGLLNDAQRAFAAKLEKLAEGQSGERRSDLDELAKQLDYDPDELTATTCAAVRLISAPIFDADGNVALAMTIYGFPRPESIDDVHHYAQALLASTAKVTDMLNGHEKLTEST